MTASLLSPLGSSKPKQSPQFDPAKQAYAGKVWVCHERRKRNVGDSMYPAGDSLGKADDSGSAESFLTALGTEVQLSITSSYFVL